MAAANVTKHGNIDVLQQRQQEAAPGGANAENMPSQPVCRLDYMVGLSTLLPTGQRIPTNQHLIYGSIQFAKINHSWVYLRRYQLGEALDLAQQGLINTRTNGLGPTIGTGILRRPQYHHL